MLTCKHPDKQDINRLVICNVITTNITARDNLPLIQ